jgi:hypothetical protein
MGPRCRRITENDGLLEKVGTNLLNFTAQNRNFFRIVYHLTELSFIYFTYINVYCEFCPLIQYLGLNFTAFLLKKR